MVAIPVASASGVALTGLTPGVTYSVWTEGGPWYPTGNSSLPGAYGFALSTDGLVWSQLIGTSLDPWANYITTPLSDTFRPAWTIARQNLDSVHVLFNFQALGSSIFIRAGDNPAEFGDNTGSLSAEVGAGTLPFCQYGTAPQGALTGGTIITTALIDILLTYVGVPVALTTLFDALIGKVLWGGDLCNGLPPVMPNFTNDDFLGGTGIPNPASIGKVWQAFQAIAWPYFCQCNAGPMGSPPAIIPPLPTVIAPAAAPLGPIQVNCDSADICALLNQLARQLSGMSQQIGLLRSDVTLIQRQSVPFAYIPGTLHAGLTGTGQLAVQGLVGIAVEITTVPGAAGETSGDPIARFGLGWVAFGTPDGWRLSVPIRHNPLWADAAPDDTLVGYSFEPLVVANIQEFVREPA